jgi:hypothetical protein
MALFCQILAWGKPNFRMGASGNFLYEPIPQRDLEELIKLLAQNQKEN